MKRLRVLVMAHEDLVPPDSLDGVENPDAAEWKTEYDVVVALEHLGHDVKTIGVGDELASIRGPGHKRTFGRTKTFAANRRTSTGQGPRGISSFTS